MRFKRINILISALIISAPWACTNQPVLSQLVNDRVTLNLKTSYESNDPAAWSTLQDPEYWGSVSDSALNGVNPVSGLKYYIDLAEIRVSRGSGPSTGDNPDDYWEFIGKDRRLFCSEYQARNGKTLENCQNQNGIASLEALLSDSGYTYPAVDVPGKVYNHLGIYFRKFIIYPSNAFDTSGNKTGEAVSNFDNREITGANIEEFYQLAPGSTATDPLMFPLERLDLALDIDREMVDYTLEVRVFLRNLLMKHIAESGDSRLSFVGPADWRNAHDYNGETFDRLGGNFIFTARTYKPSDVGTIDISGLSTTANTYIVAVTAGSSFNAASDMPPLATSSTASQITNVMPGTYDIYSTCDKNSKNADGTTNTGTPDGYPETSSALCDTVTVTTGTTVSATGTCTCT